MRGMVLAILVVLLGGVAVSTAAMAAEDGCKSETVSATGKPSSIGELARANAFFTWKAVAREKFGTEFQNWSKATERKLVCVDLMSGENKGKWECTRSARPCPAKVIVTPAAERCKETATSAYGARRGTIVAAKAQARAGWKVKVIELFGEEWAEWDNADKSSFDCRRKNSWQYQCIAQAYACQK
ncbi:MAG: hypothetical protein DHS20C08_10820 [Rhodomicrobium sp.]|nr:MAG: hypothetical protein DHS20C08_10820 [Rhodomicrobium sp.]